MEESVRVSTTDSVSYSVMIHEAVMYTMFRFKGHCMPIPGRNVTYKLIFQDDV